MPEAYNPDSFWRVALSVHKGMHTMVPHAVLLMLPAVIVVLLIELREEVREIFLDEESNYDFGLLILPFTTLVALLTSFRVNAAFNKWLNANQHLEMLHSNVCNAVARVTTFVPHSDGDEFSFTLAEDEGKRNLFLEDVVY